MSNFRRRWLALFGATALIALSMSSAMAHDPAGKNHATDVAGFVETGDQEAADETENADETQVDTEESAPSDHGKCVALVAQNKEAVGPPNDNHGGAVSEAARVDCQPDAAPQEQNTEDSASDEDASEVDADDADEAAEEAETDDADASDADASDAGKSHGEGHGKNKD
jgi:hypothetical protein